MKYSKWAHFPNLSFYSSAACKSGQCTCGICTGSSKKVPNGSRYDMMYNTKWQKKHLILFRFNYIYRCSDRFDCESGYCKNGELDTSIGCAGRCVPKLSTGGDCSKVGVANLSLLIYWVSAANGYAHFNFTKSALNINVVDPTKLFTAGDDKACISNKCLCGRCTDSSNKLPNNQKCSDNS